MELRSINCFCGVVERSCSNRYQKFSVTPSNTYIEPSDVFELFLDITDDLLLEKDGWREMNVRGLVNYELRVTSCELRVELLNNELRVNNS